MRQINSISYYVFSVVDRDEEEADWHKIGHAIKNESGYTIHLDSLPYTRELVLLMPRETPAVQQPRLKIVSKH